MKNDNPYTGSAVKILSPLSKYRPAPMTDETVYDMAQHYYTAEEICLYFNVGFASFNILHGDAFRAGKAAASQMPRMLLNKIFKDFALLGDGMFARTDVPTNTLLKAIEIHARKYEGYGQEQKVTISTELPSVADIKFIPLQKNES